MHHHDADGSPNFGNWREPLLHNIRNEAKASEMFYEMQGIVKKWGHDYHATRYMPDTDPMISTAISTVRADTIRREEMHAASSVKNKFTSIYWKEWNSDVSLLQDMSAKDPPRNETAVDATKRRLKEYAKLKKNKKEEKRGIHVAFAPPPRPKYSSSEMFDSHLIGNGIIDNEFAAYRKTDYIPRFLTEKCLGREFRKAGDMTSNHYDPEALGNKICKGGLMSQSDKFEKVSIYMSVQQYRRHTQVQVQYKYEYEIRIRIQIQIRTNTNTNCIINMLSNQSCLANILIAPILTHAVFICH